MFTTTIITNATNDVMSDFHAYVHNFKQLQMRSPLKKIFQALLGIKPDTDAVLLQKELWNYKTHYQKKR